MFLSPASRARMRLRDYGGIPPYQLSATASNSNLYITLGPQPGVPMPMLPFRDATNANGDLVFRPILAGTQFIISNGSFLGVSNNVPFRLWVVGFDTGSGIILGAINCLVGAATPTQIFPLDETTVQSPTGGNGGSSAGVFYASVALTSRPFRILGFLEWASGQPSASAWTKPTKVQVFGPGIKKPGDEVQRVYATSTTASSVGATATSPPTFTNFLTASISPTSAANPVEISGVINAGIDPGTTTGFVQLVRGSTPIFVGTGGGANQPAVSGSIESLFNSVLMTCPLGPFLDAPNSTSAQSYRIATASVGGSTFLNESATDSNVNTRARGATNLQVREIMA